MNIKKVIAKEDSGYKSKQQPCPLPLSFSWCLTAGMPSRELAALAFSLCAHMEFGGLRLGLGGCSGDPCFCIYTSCSPFAFG